MPKDVRGRKQCRTGQQILKLSPYPPSQIVSLSFISRAAISGLTIETNWKNDRAVVELAPCIASRSACLARRQSCGVVELSGDGECVEEVEWRRDLVYCCRLKALLLLTKLLKESMWFVEYRKTTRSNNQLWKRRNISIYLSHLSICLIYLSTASDDKG